MLSYLRIRGLALLEDVALELSPGMNVLTGETGAGKSIIVDALTLLRGSRGRAELVRAGTESASVDAQFELSGAPSERVQALLERHALPHEDPAALILGRVLSKSGRGRSVVQGELTTQIVLGEIGSVLIDICSQHEHHSLTNVSSHVELLDSFLGLDAAVRGYQIVHREHQETERALDTLRSRLSERTKRADYLRFQLEELERVAPLPGEHEELKGRLGLLRDARRWAEFARDAQESLSESEHAVVGQLALLVERCRSGIEHSPRLARLFESLEAAHSAASEAAQEAFRFGAELEIDPEELEQAEQRLHELTLLSKKHGGTLEDLTQSIAAMQTELTELGAAEERLSELETRAAEQRRRSVELAAGLTRARKAGCQELSKALETELASLHLGRARIAAAIEPLPGSELGPRGADKVEFMFSANPGEPLAPLSRVASGGELSRVLLALKGVLATGDSVATYVFDEVDAGVGGAVAEAIGRRLGLAAQAHQVLCITHLPQIASFADAHYRVDKRQAAGRTVTAVVRLDEAERVEELARMLGGAKVGDSARKHARELLHEARSVRSVAVPAARAARSTSRARSRT